jgi:hypothetical protein
MRTLIVIAVVAAIVYYLCKQQPGMLAKVGL